MIKISPPDLSSRKGYLAGTVVTKTLANASRRRDDRFAVEEGLDEMAGEYAPVVRGGAMPPSRVRSLSFTVADVIAAIVSVCARFNVSGLEVKEVVNPIHPYTRYEAVQIGEVLVAVTEGRGCDGYVEILAVGNADHWAWDVYDHPEFTRTIEFDHAVRYAAWLIVREHINKSVAAH